MREEKERVNTMKEVEGGEITPALLLPDSLFPTMIFPHRK